MKRRFPTSYVETSTEAYRGQVRKPVPSASGSRQTRLRQGRAYREVGASVAGRDRLELDQLDAVAGCEAFDMGDPGGVAGVAAAGDDQQVDLGAPAVPARRPSASVAPLTESMPASEAQPLTGPGRWL